MYSEDSLNAVFKTASDRALSDEGFAEFQRRHLKQAFPAFDYDRSTTSLIETQHETQTVSVESILMNFEASLEEVMASYMGAVDHDFLAKIVYANPGRLFLHTDVLEGKLEQHPIFVLHCKKFDIYKDYAIGFNLIAAAQPKWNSVLNFLCATLSGNVFICIYTYFFTVTNNLQIPMFKNSFVFFFC